MSLLADLIFGATLLPHYGWHRWVTNKYGPAAPEKLGYPPLREGDAPALWLHAVSVGETIAARPLLNAFAAEHPRTDIRVSTTTATGRSVAVKQVGEDRVFYYPLDLSWMTARALDSVRPDVIVLMELEVWPNFIEQANARNIPVVVANVRMTERSYLRFRRAGRLVRPMFDGVTLWLCQTAEYADRLTGLGVSPGRVHVVGSLKYDAVPTEIDPGIRDTYRTILGGDTGGNILIGGSTHPSEEDALLACWQTLRKDHPGLRLVLVPRHPERLDAVEKLARSRGEVVRRSTLSPESPATSPLVLVDTMGELSSLYAAADAVFVGGSLIDHGGQNMMEPCGLARPTVMGPSYHNFSETVNLLREREGIRIVSGADEIASAFGALLDDAGAASAMGERAREALVEQQGATRASLRLIAPLLPESPD